MQERYTDWGKSRKPKGGRTFHSFSKPQRKRKGDKSCQRFFSLFALSLFEAQRKQGIRKPFKKSGRLVNYLSNKVPLRSIPQIVTRSFLQAAVAAALLQRRLLFFLEEKGNERRRCPFSLGTGFPLSHIFCPVFPRCAGGIFLKYSGKMTLR